MEDARSCPVCGKPISKWRKSCSVECANALRTKPDVPCARPGCPNMSAKTKGGTKYCHISCFNLHRRERKKDLVPPSCPDGVKAIPLSQGQWAFVDEADYEAVSSFNWCVANAASSGSSPIYYAKRTDNNQYMHAFLLGLTGGSAEGLHGTGGTLDNTRRNIRSGTGRENQRDRGATGSTSRYKGVSWNRQVRSWASHIAAGEKYRHIGYFHDEIDAAMAYDVQARELHREFGRYNFPLSDETSALGPETDRTCAQCGLSFLGPVGLDYCGKRCLISSSISSRPCLSCGVLISGLRKFCGLACRRSFSVLSESSPFPVLVPGATWIRLSLGKFCLIDDADSLLVLGPGRDQKWYAKEGNSGNWYACRAASSSERAYFGRVVLMHRLLSGLTKNDGRDVDHADRNGLNNRRENFRITNNSGNHMNEMFKGASGYKGVSDLGEGWFLAKIYANGRYEYLGRFRDPAEAARTYDARARVLHGPSGRYNFPVDGENSAS